MKKIADYSFGYVYILPFVLTMLNLFCGIALLRVNYRKDWNRITGWMFILNSIMIFSLTMNWMSLDNTGKMYWDLIFKFINPSIAFMIIYFALIFPQPRFSRRTNRLILLGMFVIYVVFSMISIFDAGLFWSVKDERTVQATYLYSAYSIFPYTFAFLLAGLLWFDRYRRESDRKVRKQLSILLVGFLFTPIVETVFGLYQTDITFLLRDPYDIHNVNLIIHFLFLIIPISAYVVLDLINSMRKGKGKSHDKILFFGMMLAYLFGIIITCVPLSSNFFKFTYFGMIGFALVRPLCFTYAVLKYQLFNIDIIIKRSTKIFVILAIIGLVFAGMQELIELILPFSRIISALIVAMAFIPIERLSEKITNRLFPWNEVSEEYVRERRKEIYVAALEGAYYDAILTRDEEKMLARLRKQFEITEDEHLRYAHEAQKSVLPGALGTCEEGEGTTRKKILFYALSISILFILFVVGQELIENVLPMPTIVSAILISLLFIPIKYLLDKYIIKRFKGEQKKTDARSQAIAVYESILRDAWEDRIITDMESDMLRFIRKELGISEEEHREMAGKVFV